MKPAELFLETPRDICVAERQILKALPKMGKASPLVPSNIDCTGTVQLTGSVGFPVPFSRSGRLDLLTAGQTC